MPPNRPIELVNASKACSEAWQRRDDMIEANDSIGIMAMNSACGILDAHYATLYQEWQILGGTSDIDSLAFPAVGESPISRQMAHTPTERDNFPQFERTEEEARALVQQTYGASVIVSSNWLRRHL